MPRRAPRRSVPWLLALAALLAAPAAAATSVDASTAEVASAGGVAGVRVDVDGDPLTVAYASDDTLAPGDDRLEVTEGLRGVEASWVGAPLDLEMHAGLRGVAVHHGLATRTGAMADVAQGWLPPGARPLVVFVGEEGADARLASGEEWPAVGETWLVGGTSPAMVWPAAWSSFGWGVGGNDLTLPEALIESSDAALRGAAIKARIVCEGVREHAGAVVPLCSDLGGVAQGALPEVALHGELQEAGLRLVRELRAAAAPPAAAGAAFFELPAAAPGGVAWAAAAGAIAPRGDLRTEPSAAPPAAAAREPGLRPAANLLAGGSVTWVSSWLPLALAAGLLAVPVWALYRRILPHRALAHPVRERLLEAVRAHPGIHESDLAREVGLRHNHVQYHLRVLEEVGIVETRHFGGLKCIFELGKLSPAEKAMAMAQRGRSQEVLTLVSQEPGIAQRELARRLGMSESSIKWHLDRLEGSGVVRAERARGAKRVWPMLGPAPALPAPGVAVPAPL